MNHLKIIKPLLFCLLGLLLAGSAYSQGKSGLKILNSYKLGGEGGWDYLTFDDSANRLFISRGTHTMAVDPDSGKVLGDIPDTAGVHGIALAQDVGKGFTSNGRANNVTIFDLKTLQKTGEVKTGENPDAIVYDSTTQRVFTMNGRSKDATAIDAKTGEVAGEVKLDGRPEFAVADKGKIYVNIEDKNEIQGFDAKSLKVENTWPIEGCQAPSGLSMDHKTRRLFSGCSESQTLTVVNADNGKVVVKIPIGKGEDATAFDPGMKTVYSSNGGDTGTLTVIQEQGPDKYIVLDNVVTKPRARTMAVSEKSHKIYLVTADFNPPKDEKSRPTMIPDTFTLLVVGK